MDGSEINQKLGRGFLGSLKIGELRTNPGFASMQRASELTFSGGLNGSKACSILQAKEEAPQKKTGLPDHLKSAIEIISGMDLSSIRVHYNSPRPAKIRALAYTQGREIYVGPGQEHSLPHEAWHVVQQMQGRVKPTMQFGGLLINDNLSLEREANRIQTMICGFSKRHSFDCGSHIIDNLLNAASQIKTKEIVENSPQVKNPREFQEIADDSGLDIAKANYKGIIQRKAAPHYLRNMDIVIINELCRQYGLTVVGTRTGWFFWTNGGSQEERHVHVEFEVVDNNLTRFRFISPKDYLQPRPDLANQNTDFWLGLVNYMNPITQNSVNALKRLIEERGL